MLTGGARLGAAMCLVAVVAGGCRFPDTCESYAAADSVSTVKTDLGTRSRSCELTLALDGLTYVSKTDAIVTEVGEELAGVRIRECQAGLRSTFADAATQGVKAFHFGDYCTSDVIAVEVAPGEQLLVFEVKDTSTPILR
jgi:hypothetical protein